MQKGNITRGCIKFLIGWSRRFAEIAKIFVFPLNRKEHPHL